MVSTKLSDELRGKIVKHIEENQPEVYWDYREELSNEQIATIFEKGQEGLWEIENEIIDMNADHSYDLEKECIKAAIEEYIDEIREENDDEDLDAGELKDEWWDDLIEHVSLDWNISDLVKRTSDVVVFYDTGYEVEVQYGCTPQEYSNAVKEIKKVLSIKIKDKTFDKKILTMLYQASYGGQLVVYFRCGVDHFSVEESWNTIGFKNAHIAVINTGNGSGDSMHLDGHEFDLKWNRENLFHERSIKYNYTYAVCGMSSDWCDDTQFFFRTKTDKKGRSLKPIKASPINAHLEQEKRYNATYKAGKCTAGDMDYGRHRNMTYINNFPCGNKCLDCGTFWID